MRPAVILGIAALVLVGCREELARQRPVAVAMTDDALGHYCQMALDEHPGPKAQIHLEGTIAPLFFAQVRDAIAYQRMPEQSHAITAVYVSDMSVAESWEMPGENNWIAIEDAQFVVGSSAVGGMGAAELVPFGTTEAAAEFAARRGGQVVGLERVDDRDVLAPVKSAGEDNYRERLKALSDGEQG